MKKLLICCLSLFALPQVDAQVQLPQAEIPLAQLRAGETGDKSELTEPLHGYDVNNTLAVFPGGEAEMVRFIQEHLEYPELARSHAHEGTVFIEYVITEDGRIGRARALQGIGMGCDEAALAVFKKMPRWKPAVRRGRPVQVKCITPVRFRLY